MLEDANGLRMLLPFIFAALFLAPLYLYFLAKVIFHAYFTAKAVYQVELLNAIGRESDPQANPGAP